MWRRDWSHAPLLEPQTSRFNMLNKFVKEILANPVEINTYWINPLRPELNPPAQRCLMRFFTGEFASWTVHFFNICVKNQQIHQLFIQFINYVWYLLHAPRH
jgi:hypothetical protein